MKESNDTESRLRKDSMAARACSQCGVLIPTAAKFCLECGAPTAIACSACGASISATAKFCLECGASQNTEQGTKHWHEPVSVPEQLTSTTATPDEGNPESCSALSPEAEREHTPAAPVISSEIITGAEPANQEKTAQPSLHTRHHNALVIASSVSIIIVALFAVLYWGFGLFRETPPVPVAENLKWGYINANGKWVIPAQFDEAYWFSEGKKPLARVLSGEKWGFIDTSGHFVIRPQFDYAFGFTEGFARVTVAGKCGFINEAGSIAIPAQYEGCGAFNKGLAWVEEGKKWGIINKSGTFISSPQFEDVSAFQFGLAQARVNGVWGYVDQTGRFVIPPRFSQASSFSSDKGTALVEQDGKWGPIDRTGQFTSQPAFSSIGSDFSEGMIPVELGGEWGYVNAEGHVVIRPQYEAAGPFSEGKAPVQTNGKWGFIDKEGKTVIEPEYFAPGLFHNKLAIVNHGTSVISTSGKEVWSPSPTSWEGTFVKQLLPIIDSRLHSIKTPPDYRWVSCKGFMPAQHAICAHVDKGNPDEVATAIYSDDTIDKEAASLGFDGLLFDDASGNALYGLQPTPDGWKVISSLGIPSCLANTPLGLALGNAERQRQETDWVAKHLDGYIFDNHWQENPGSQIEQSVIDTMKVNAQIVGGCSLNLTAVDDTKAISADTGIVEGTDTRVCSINLSNLSPKAFAIKQLTSLSTNEEIKWDLSVNDNDAVSCEITRVDGEGVKTVAHSTGFFISFLGREGANAWLTDFKNMVHENCSSRESQ
jgi:hypothetical protein